MKRSAHLPILTTFLLLTAAMCVGCDSQDADTAASNALRRDPQESFHRILESFRRKVEEQPVGFVVSQGGSRSTMVGTNKVTSEFIPPARPHEHYKANINVTSQSQYSLRRVKSADDADRDQTDKNQTKNPLDSDDKKGNDFLAPPKLSTTPSDDRDNKKDSKSKDSSEETVTRRPDETTRKYELVYENDKWLLLTELDPKTEKSIQFAFEEALAVQ